MRVLPTVQQALDSQLLTLLDLLHLQGQILRYFDMRADLFHIEVDLFSQLSKHLFVCHVRVIGLAALRLLQFFLEGG
jgi:hypothetical protein